MPRPRKYRKVCCLPKVNEFGPLNVKELNNYVIMTVEEYETIRLMDLENLSQEETAERMGVARSTIQRIYEEARRKIADFIVNGKTLKIEGGDYRVCDFNVDNNRCALCRRHGKMFGKEKD
ncbi:MAG: putative DNA-binding protein [Caloramator sp.]|uniref:DUF134 domain-containing protein n=1 Tax=Caloramator sp. TaxID=1871330 RepID=UPI001D2FAED6|nr:DUF134 domain-containing protein [Caloramator sp.]MBZ4664074.1 putative DNA-binding protein [Caloramator sp.]